MMKSFIFIGLGLLALAAPMSLRAEEPSAAEPSNAMNEIKLATGYDDGFFIVTPDDKFKLKIGGYIQELFEYDHPDIADDSDTFRVRRARLNFSGNLYAKWVKYMLEYDFSSTKLLNAYIQLAHCDALKLTVGQFYVPYDFEDLVSSSSLQFVDRSLTNAVFGIPDQREPGIGIDGAVYDKMFAYYLGAFNGEGLNNLNTNKDLRWVARLEANLLGQHGNAFSDTKNSQEPQLIVGVAGQRNNTFDPTVTFEQEVSAVTGDASFKYMGIGAHAAYFFRHTDPDVGTETDDTGWLAQVGYFLIPEHLEVAARADQVMPDAGGDKGEYTGAINYFIFGGHHVKLQLDYSILTTENGAGPGSDTTDQRFRAQMSVSPAQNFLKPPPVPEMPAVTCTACLFFVM